LGGSRCHPFAHAGRLAPGRRGAGFPWAPFGAVLIGICASIAAADAFGFAALTG
jgi:hypothetical protein